MLKQTKLKLALAISGTLLAVNAQAAFISISSDQQGWFRSDGGSNGNSNGNNTFTESSNSFVSFAGFNLNAIATENFANASISMGSHEWAGGHQSFDITGVNGSLNYSSIFSGTVIGQGTTTNGILNIVFNSAGLSFLNSNKTSIAETYLGFVNTSGLPASDLGFYNNRIDGGIYTGGTRYTPSIIVDTTVAVPEPTSIALLGMGLLGFAASRRKKSA